MLQNQANVLKNARVSIIGLFSNKGVKTGTRGRFGRIYFHVAMRHAFLVYLLCVNLLSFHVLYYIRS